MPTPNLHIEGLVPPDEKFKKMLAIFKLCREQKIEVPEEVWLFFNNEEPDEGGVKIPLSKEKWRCEWGEGYHVEVKDIPKDVKTIRFYLTW